MPTKLKLITREAFDRLSKNGQRVAIAKDVIARLNAKLVIPSGGKLFTLRTRNNVYNAVKVICKSTLQEFVNENRCEGCAKGAMACSWIGSFNRWNALPTSYQMGSHADYPKQLLNIFGRDLMDAIEMAYEGRGFNHSSRRFCQELIFGKQANHLWPEGQMIVDAFKHIPKRKRMKAVFANIVKNRGKLKAGSLVIQ